ncbi:D-alanyl-D-alanine carboxypeptidase family protein [Patescibacteria group bacterium]
MIAKILITISIVLSPLTLIFESALNKPSNVLNQQSQNTEYQLEKWNKYQQSSISSLLAGNPNFLPIRNWSIDDPDVDASAALVFESSGDKILFQKNIDQPLPIASLTKIITALVVLDHLSIGETTIISSNAINAYGEQGGLVENEEISIENLLYALLMESSNDAAVALSEAVEKKIDKNFVDLMNWKSKEIMGLENTFFVDPSGYNPGNISTAKEISKILIYSLRQPIIWKIFRTSSIDLASVNGAIKHHWINTDKLLDQLSGVAGGKTGFTNEAQGCLALALECSNGNKDGYLITVVLGAKERFEQTEKLVEWAKEAYLW